MEGAGNNVELLLARELDEVHGVAGNAHRQLRIFFRMIHRIEERFTIEDVHVDVVRTFVRISSEIAVEQAREFDFALGEVFSECARNHRERVGNAVERIVIRQFRDGHHGSDSALGIAPVHRVCTRSKRRSRAATVRRVAGFLAVNDV